MKKILAAVLGAALFLICLTACQTADQESPPAQTGDTQNTPAQVPSDPVPAEEPAGKGETMIYAHIGDRTLTIKPADNSSAEAFVALLKKGDITVAMHDYGGFEKVGSLGTSLPTNDERITTEPGDVILYLGNQITIYYDTNTWSFTRLGKVQGMTRSELREALGNGDPTVVFSLRKD